MINGLTTFEAQNAAMEMIEKGLTPLQAYAIGLLVEEVVTLDQKAQDAATAFCLGEGTMEALDAAEKALQAAKALAKESAAKAAKLIA